MARLFDPITIGTLNLKNRIVMAPMATGMATAEGWFTDRHIKHYSARAGGGAGLIIIEHTFVRKDGKLSERQSGIYDDAVIPGLRRLTDAIHQEGAKVVIQITHGGGKSAGGVTGQPVIGPSAVVVPGSTELPRAMSGDDMNDIKECFSEAARRAIEAGCDSVELHGAHGFLLNQFISPFTNRRKDDYGGSLENRCRFPIEVIKAVKTVLGERPLFYRFGADDMIEGGLTPEEGKAAAVLLETAGVDVLDISAGINAGESYNFTEKGFFIPLAAGIKNVVGIPVIGVGNITEAGFADSLLVQEKVDLVAIGRKLLSDPDFPNQALADLKKQ